MSVKARKKGKAIGGRKKGTAPGTINRELATLSHLLSRALEWGWITQKSAVVKRLSLENPCKIALTPEQSKALVKASEVDTNRYINLFIMIGLSTSMRKGEILSIRAEHIDLARSIIHIPFAKKGPRDQPMTPALCDIFRGFLDMAACTGRKVDWIFSAKSKSGHVVNIRTAFERVVIAAGLDPKKVTPHTLRRTVITQLRMSGQPVPVIMKVSGHSAKDMVEYYSVPNDTHVQRAMTELMYQLPI
jgi:integrase